MAMASSKVFSGRKERVVLIVGASSGIGASIALHLSSIGYTKLALVARRSELLHEVALKCEEEGEVQVLEIARDATDKGAAHSIVQETVEAFGRLDALIVSAATLGPVEPLLSSSEKDFDRVLRTNVYIPLSLSQKALPHLTSSQGCILFLSSVASTRCAVNFGLYSMSKAALNAMARSLAAEQGPKGVRVNTLSPGPVLTSMLVKAAGLEHHETGLEVLRGSESARALPLGGYADAVDVAKVAAFIIDKDDNRLMTGTDVVADNGFLLT